MQKGFAPVLLFVGVAIIAAIVGGAFYFGKLTFPFYKSPEPSPTPIPKACTQEAKICPDGTSVGRTGPNCEFTPCPSANKIDETANWKTYTNSTYSYSFKYPEDWNLDASESSLASAATLSKNGYEFSFFYNLSGVGEAPSVAAHTEDIYIDNIKFLKVYINQETKPSCHVAQGIDIQTGEELKPKEECYEYFNKIYLNNPSTYTGTGGSLLDVHGKTSTVEFSLPRLMKLNDKEFLQYNEIFKGIISSMKLPK